MPELGANGPPHGVAEECAKTDPSNELEHYVVCPVCGQILDCRDARQVAHHTEALHNPLL
jgi:hypothetical protein